MNKKTRPNGYGHPFEVGEVFGNRRGAYVVVRLDDSSDTMVVQYVENEEEAELTISTQHRIWQNMDGEKRAATKKKAEELERFARALGRDFEGLQDSDFKSNVDGTHWRSRQSLGGRVARLLSEKTALQFVSVPIYRWPVVFLSHRERAEVETFEAGAPYAKFTIEVDDEGVYYGFYVERDPKRTGDGWDWQRLVNALTHDRALSELVERLECDREMLFTARASSSEEHFHYRNGLTMGADPLWEETTGAGSPLTLRLDRLAGVRDGWWGELYMLASQPREQAIAAGEDLAETIASLMAELAPIYKVAAELSLSDNG